MTDRSRPNVIVSSSSSENSNDSDAAEDDKSSAAKTQLSQKELIARNKEKAMQLRAAKRSLPQEPSKLVQRGLRMDCFGRAVTVLIVRIETVM